MNEQSPESDSLYAAREPVFPKRVKGKFRTLKWWIMGITLGVYYLVPWIRWDRGPNLPDQAVLVDLANRRFFMFWIEIWPHEFYFVAGLLIMAGLGLFLFTSALGRVWCGYACPQTVWTDLFILVERWIEGDRNARVRLWKQKMNARKLRLNLTKWAVWLLISVMTGGAWIFYFSDAPTLLVNVFTGQAPFVAYGTIAVLTATTFVFGGFMREQICTYACPWPRIQAAMFDEDTLTVGYREWRGEPRGKLRRKQPENAEPKGDCIDCLACVAVCPVGIDIRDGQQLECITCALCIDACDEMMVKVGKPTGLIGYMAVKDEELERSGHPPRSLWKHIFRPRTLLYTAIWAAVGLGLLVALFIRSDISFSVAPVRNPTFVMMSDGSVRNTYDLRLSNMGGEDRQFVISAVSDYPLDIDIQGVEGTLIDAKADDTTQLRMFLTAPYGSEAASIPASDVTIRVEQVNGTSKASAGTVFNGTGE